MESEERSEKPSPVSGPCSPGDESQATQPLESFQHERSLKHRICAFFFICSILTNPEEKPAMRRSKP
jgi:hypothetical protein